MKLPVTSCRSQIKPADRRRERSIVHPAAFSLLEVIVVVSLLSVIILGLVAMFGQTQRAFRTGMTQVDVLESGRMASDLIAREIEQVTPAYLPAEGRVFNQRIAQPNFYAWRQDYWPLVLALPGSRNSRTNLLDDLFFIYRRNQEWVGVSYFVRSYDPLTRRVGMPVIGSSPEKAGVGVLYRYETSAYPLSPRTIANLFEEFFNVAYTNRWLGDTLPPTRIIDGVAHFKLRAYDTNGFCLTNDLPHNTGFSKSYITKVGHSTPLGDIDRYTFFSNAVPASVELQLGILEDRAWERFQSLPDNASRSRYLTNQTGRLHVFRQRIPVRNVDPLAYQ